MKKVCHYCRKEVLHQWTGEKLADGSRVYVNNEGKRWAGRRCPKCERHRVQVALKLRSLERKMILKKLKSEGFEIINKTLPFKIQKDCEIKTVGIRYMTIEDGQVFGSFSSQEEGEKSCDFYALVVSSVRFCSPSQLDRLTLGAEKILLTEEI